MKKIMGLLLMLGLMVSGCAVIDIIGRVLFPIPDQAPADLPREPAPQPPVPPDTIRTDLPSSPPYPPIPRPLPSF